jgi:hypothetical protein
MEVQLILARWDRRWDGGQTASCVVPEKVTHMSQQTASPTFRQRWLARTSWLAFLAHDLEKAVQAQRMGSLAEAGVPEVIARRLPELPHTRRFWFGLAAFALVAQVAVHRWSRESGLGRRALRLVLWLRAANAAWHAGRTVAQRRYAPGSGMSPATLIAALLLLRSVKKRFEQAVDATDDRRPAIVGRSAAPFRDLE